MNRSKISLAPGSGAQFGLSAGGVQARANGNPLPYILPWAMAFGLLILAMGIRFGLASDTLAWYWSAFCVVVYTCLTYVTWRASRARGALTCGLATGGVGLAAAWSWYIAGVPDLTWRPFAVYAGFAVVICGGSMMFSAFRHGQGDGRGMHDQLSGAVTKMRALNEVTAKDGQVVARFEMEPGTAAADLQSSAPSLASLYGVAADGVRVLPNKDNAREGELRISPTNPLGSAPVWPGPSIRQGGTVMDPIVIGTRRGGQPSMFWLPGDHKTGRNASLIQITGMPGAGKTVVLRITLVELLSRGMPDECEYWYGNTRKADQEPEWVIKGAARVERDRKGVAAMLRELRDEAPERASKLGARGFDQWQPGCGIPFRLVVIDEAADVASDLERILTDLAETVRSLGVILVLGFQRASGSRFPTDARSNFGTHLCFGVKDETDAAMALPEEVLDAGAAPWLWGNKVPGMHYLSAPGVPEDLWTDPARTFNANRELMAKWAEFYIAQRTGGAAATAGQSSEAARPDTPARRPSPTPRHRADERDHGHNPDRDIDGELVDERDEEGLDDVFDLDDFDEGEAADEAEDMLQEVTDDLGDDDLDDEFDPDVPRRPVVPPDCHEAFDIDGREPIEVSGGGMRLALSPQMPPREARQHVRTFLAELRERGVARFKKEDMAGDILAAVGYKGSWLDKVLGEFCAERPTWLRKTDERGWYDIIASPVQAIESDAA